MLIEQYAVEQPCSSSETAAPLLDGKQLERQATGFVGYMRTACANVIMRLIAAEQVAKAAKGGDMPPSAMTSLWRQVDSNITFSVEMTLYFIPAKVALVMVSGGVENELDNSNLALFKYAKRNSLKKANLKVCMRLFSSK